MKGSPIYFSEQTNYTSEEMWEKMEEEARRLEENLKRGAISFTLEPREDLIITVKYHPEEQIKNKPSKTKKD